MENLLFLGVPILKHIRVYVIAAAMAGTQINPFALRKAKIVYNIGLSKCSRV